MDCSSNKSIQQLLSINTELKQKLEKQSNQANQKIKDDAWLLNYKNAQSEDKDTKID